MNELVISQIRTWVPLFVGALASWLATRGINLDDTAVQGLVAFLTALLGSLYYLVVRLFEKYVSPKFGWLLGYAKMPIYTVKPKLPSDL